MTNKQLKELQKINAVVNSINRILDFAPLLLKDATKQDLVELRHHLHKKAQELSKQL